MRERLRAQAHAEERSPLGDEASQRLVLLAQPGMLELLADVLVAAEHQHRIGAVGRCALQSDVPLHQLVPGADDHVAEQLGPHEWAVNDREHLHQAVGIFSSSSSLRRS